MDDGVPKSEIKHSGRYIVKTVRHSSAFGVPAAAAPKLCGTELTQDGVTVLRITLWKVLNTSGVMTWVSGPLALAGRSIRCAGEISYMLRGIVIIVFGILTHVTNALAMSTLRFFPPRPPGVDGAPTSSKTKASGQ